MKGKRGKPSAAKQKRFDPVRGWQIIKTTLVGSMPEPQTAKGHAQIILPAYAALSMLEKGGLDEDGYFTLNSMNAVLYWLACYTSNQGTERVKTAMTENIQTTYATADALASIAERFKRQGKYGGSGEELQQIRSMIVMLDQLAEAAPFNLVVKALQEAQRMIAQYMNQRAA